MTYNLFFDMPLNPYNILGIDQPSLEIVISAYKNGKPHFTLSGQKYHLEKVSSFQIYSHEAQFPAQALLEDPGKFGCAPHGLYKTYISTNCLAKYGENLTRQLIGDSEYGSEKVVHKAAPVTFVDQKRIDELCECKSTEFDLSKLIRFCNELNDNFNNKNYLSVAMLGRSIINHVPPIFGYKTFNEVANNYNGKSFKSSMIHLNTSLRNIADNFLHETIRKKEILPNATQVNFSQDLDVLLGEIVRILK